MTRLAWRANPPAGEALCQRIELASAVACRRLESLLGAPVLTLYEPGRSEAFSWLTGQGK